MRRGTVTVVPVDKTGLVEYRNEHGVVGVGRATLSQTEPGFVSLVLPRSVDAVLVRVPADWVAELEKLP